MDILVPRLQLNSLNNKTKWMKKKRNVQVGDIVLVIQPDTKPAHWPMGRVSRAQPASDGLVRRVTVRTGKGEFERPITRIVVLPAAD